MAKKNVYLKLNGDNITLFYDPVSKITIANQMVVEVDSKSLKTKKVKEALKKGHITKTDSADFKAYQKSVDALPVPEREPKKVEELVLEPAEEE